MFFSTDHVSKTHFWHKSQLLVRLFDFDFLVQNILQEADTICFFKVLFKSFSLKTSPTNMLLKHTLHISEISALKSAAVLTLWSLL